MMNILVIYTCLFQFILFGEHMKCVNYEYEYEYEVRWIGQNRLLKQLDKTQLWWLVWWITIIIDDWGIVRPFTNCNYKTYALHRYRIPNAKAHLTTNENRHRNGNLYYVAFHIKSRLTNTIKYDTCVIRIDNFQVSVPLSRFVNTAYVCFSCGCICCIFRSTENTNYITI